MPPKTDVKMFCFTWMNDLIPQQSTKENIAKTWREFLVTGMRETSVTDVSVSGNICTIKLGANHKFYNHQVITFSGADNQLMNGDYRIIKRLSDSVQVETVGVSDGVVTGTSMKIKATPLGWSMSEKIAEQSDAQSDTYHLKCTFDGSSEYTNFFMKIHQYRTIFGMFEEYEGGQYIGKYNPTASISHFNNNSYKTKTWMMIGDKRQFFFNNNNNYDYFEAQFVGEVKTMKPNNKFSGLIMSSGSTNIMTPYTDNNNFIQPSQATNISIIQRKYTGLETDRFQTITPHSIQASLNLNYPNLYDNSLPLFDILLVENNALVGKLNGVYFTMFGNKFVFNEETIYENIQQLEGETAVVFNGYRRSLFINLHTWGH